MGPILMIPVGVFTRNLLSENGRTDMDQITNHAATLRHKQRTLRTQMLYQFLMNSVTTDFKTKLIPHLAEFRINEKPIGPCLFKKMVQPTYIDIVCNQPLPQVGCICWIIDEIPTKTLTKDPSTIHKRSLSI